MKSVSRIVSFSLIFLTTSISGGSCVAQIFGGSSKANGFVPPNGHLQMISVDSLYMRMVIITLSMT